MRSVYQLSLHRLTVYAQLPQFLEREFQLTTTNILVVQYSALGLLKGPLLIVSVRKKNAPLSIVQFAARTFPVSKC